MGRRGRFFFALFALFRTSLNVGLIERPLVVGLCWGLYSGDYHTSLAIAVFYELFWLDLIPAGTFIPPHLTASTFICLALATHFGFTTAPQVMILLFACMPLAWLGARLDGVLRDWNRRQYNALLVWSRNGDASRQPGALILRSSLSALVAHWALAFSALVVLSALLGFALRVIPSIYGLRVTWWHLWFAATLGGVMALRVKKAYLALAVGILFMLLFTIITSI